MKELLYPFLPVKVGQRVRITSGPAPTSIETGVVSSIRRVAGENEFKVLVDVPGQTSQRVLTYVLTPNNRAHLINLDQVEIIGEPVEQMDLLRPDHA